MRGFPGGSAVKNLPADAGDMGLIPGLGRSPEGGNDTPLQYSCLGKPMGRGAWQAIAYGVTEELDTTQRLNSSSSPPRPAAVLWSLGVSFASLSATAGPCGPEVGCVDQKWAMWTRRASLFQACQNPLPGLCWSSPAVSSPPVFFPPLQALWLYFHLFPLPPSLPLIFSLFKKKSTHTFIYLFKQLILFYILVPLYGMQQS